MNKYRVMKKVHYCWHGKLQVGIIFALHAQTSEPVYSITSRNSNGDVCFHAVEENNIYGYYSDTIDDEFENVIHEMLQI